MRFGNGRDADRGVLSLPVCPKTAGERQSRHGLARGRFPRTRRAQNQAKELARTVKSGILCLGTLAARTTERHSPTVREDAMSARRGFTLIELLVVIAIIVLLVAVFPVSYTHLTLPTN